MLYAAIPWLGKVTQSDLQLAGIDVDEGGRSPSDTLIQWVSDFGVDLIQVQACMDLLAQHAVLLHTGSPLGLMSYSRRLGKFRASFDGMCPLDLRRMEWPAAGTWLSVLAAESGPLPTVLAASSILRVGPGGLSGTNTDAVRRYHRYAQAATGAQDITALDGYDRAIGHAVWCCAGHAVR